MPIVSVIVPSYRVEAYIAKCLDSLIAQDFQDFDVHVIDDGSPENERVIVEPYTQKYPNIIRYRRQTNGGYGSVLEYAFSNLSSKYILICDPDDWLKPNALNYLVNLAEKQEADVVCASRYVTYSEEDATHYDKMFNSAYVQLKHEHVYRKEDESFKDVYMIENAPHGKLFKRSLLDGLAFPHKTTNTDALLFYYALFKSQRVVYSMQAIAYYLVDRAGNSVTEVRPGVVDELNRVYTLILEHSQKFNDLPASFYFQMFMSYYYICDRCDILKGDMQLRLSKLNETAVILSKLQPMRSAILDYYKSLPIYDRKTALKYELILNPIFGALIRRYWYRKRLSRPHQVQYYRQIKDRILENRPIKVSVIVPIYNVEAYLERCLMSLVNQSLEEIEILCVNDGSKDNSQEIIDRFVEKYPNKVVSLPKLNGGLSDARNHGIKFAKGEFLAFIDSDDWVDLDMMKDLFEAAHMTQSDIAVSDMEYVYDNGQTSFSSGGDFTITEIDENPAIITINNSACNKLYHRELFENVEFFKGIWYEDLATVPKVIALSKRIVKVNKAHYKYFQRWNSIVHTQNPKVFDIYTALRTVSEFLKGIDQYDRYRAFIQDLYVTHGADLTTVRIKDFDKERIEYLKRNMLELRKAYPHWYFNRKVWSAPLKKKIVFSLNRLGLYPLLLWLYDRRGNHEEENTIRK